MVHKVFVLILLCFIIAGNVEAGFMKKEDWEETHVKFDCQYKNVADKLIAFSASGGGTAELFLREKVCSKAGNLIKDFYYNIPYTLERETIEKFGDKAYKNQYSINANQLCHALMDLAFTLKGDTESIKKKFGIDDIAMFFSKSVFVLYLTKDLNLEKTMKVLSNYTNKRGMVYYGTYYPWALNLAIFFFEQENPHSIAVDMVKAILNRDIKKMKEIVHIVEKETNFYKDACIDMSY